MLKIAHVYYGLNYGGIERLISEMANHQSIEGNAVDVITVNELSSQNLEPTLRPEIRVVRLDRKIGSMNIFFAVRLLFELGLRKYDIVHVHSAQLGRLPSFNLNRSKLIVHVHAINHICSGRFPKCKSVIGVSNAVCDELKNKYNVNHAQVIYNGVNIKDIKKRNFLGVTKKIVSVGTLDDFVKNQSFIIKELAPFLKANELQLHFIGDGPDRKKLMKLATNLKVNESIVFLGVKSQQWLEKNLNKYDAIIQASRSEGFNLSAVEGAIAALPLFLSRIKTHEEISQNGLHARLFDLKKEGSLHAELVTFYENYEKYFCKAGSSVAFFKKNFGQNLFFHNINRVYAEVISGKRL